MDNLKILEEKIEQDIDPNGAPQSILAANHQAILKQVLAKVGKYTGSPFIAKKTSTLYPSGTFSWNGSAVNNTSEFTVTTSKKTSDLNDFGLVLNTMANGDIIQFKDYVGRAVMLKYISHLAGTDANNQPTFEIKVQGFAENPNYVYQDNELAVAVLSINKTIGVTKPYVDEQDEYFLQLSKDYTDALVNANKQPFIESKSLNWDGVGLSFNPIGKWWFPQVSTTPFQNTKPITLDPAEPEGSGLDRIDGIAFDNTGDIVVIKGTPSADPAEPDVNPDTQLQAWFILVQAGATTPTGINKSTIYNENVQVAGGEWNTSENTAGARINLGSENEFYSGAKAIEVTAAQQYDEIIFIPETPLGIADIPEIALWQKNKAAGSNTNPFAVQVFGNRSNGKETFQYLPDINSSGYDAALTAWQQIGLDVSQNTSMVNITKIRIVILAGTAEQFGMFLDLITFSGGTVEPPPSGTSEISVQNEAGVEQFKVTEAIQFKGVDFNPISKQITVIRRLKEVVVQNKSQLLGTLQSDVLYLIDGDYAFEAGEHIIVPAGGLNIMGYSFDASRLGSYGVANHSLFKSPVGGSGNLIVHNIAFTTTGTNAGVFDLTDVDGSHALEMVTVNFEGCKKIGMLHNYRQGTGITIGIYGCADGLTLSGQWTGFKLTNTNAFGFGSTGTMFKRTSTTKFSNRLYLEVNVDLPTGAKLADFLPADFEFPELFQIANALVKLNGTIDDANATALVPNLTANNIKCLWRNNVGMPDTALEKFKETDIAGTYTINWLVDTFILNMTANTTFNETNLPASGKNTEEIKIYLTGNFIPTFPAPWIQNMVGTYKQGEVNEITLKFLKTGLYFAKISNSLSVYPAPMIDFVGPTSALPGQENMVIEVIGVFLTPESILIIEDHVMGFTYFDTTERMTFALPQASQVEGEYTMQVSNGTAVTLNQKFVVALGLTFVPQPDQYVNVTNANVSFPGQVRIVAPYGTAGSAEWTQVIDMTKNWQIRLKFKLSEFGDYAGGNNYNQTEFQLLRATDRSVFAVGQFYSNGTKLNAGVRMNVTGEGWKQISTLNKPGGMTYAEMEAIDARIQWKNGVLEGYNGTTLLSTFTTPVDDDLILVLKPRYYDWKDIKYIELYD